MCTPWDSSSLKKLVEYGLEAFKVASADFTNHEFLSEIASYGKPLICSTGMSTEQEIVSGIGHLQSAGVPFAILHCNSTYPTPFKDVNLNYISHLKELTTFPVGYSGHERGIEVPMAAVALGVKVIEKHLTVDRTMEGTDHKVSLLPQEFSNMVNGIRKIEESMGDSSQRAISQGEMMNREVLAKSIVAAKKLIAGTLISRDMLKFQSPGQGMQPNQIEEILGKVIYVEKSEGEVLFESDFIEQCKPKNFEFNHSFGLPVRYHDMAYFAANSNLDLLEIHLSYKDLEYNIGDLDIKNLPPSIVVHAQELFANDHV